MLRLPESLTSSKQSNKEIRKPRFRYEYIQITSHYCANSEIFREFYIDKRCELMKVALERIEKQFINKWKNHILECEQETISSMKIVDFDS